MLHLLLSERTNITTSYLIRISLIVVVSIDGYKDINEYFIQLQRGACRNTIYSADLVTLGANPPLPLTEVSKFHPIAVTIVYWYKFAMP